MEKNLTENYQNRAKEIEQLENKINLMNLRIDILDGNGDPWRQKPEAEQIRSELKERLRTLRKEVPIRE